MKENNYVRRGEIYYYNFGENNGNVQGGIRPVLVIQDEQFNFKAPTIIIAAITSVTKKLYLPSHVYLGDSFGLNRPSMVLLEQIRSVNKNELKDYVGFIDDTQIWKQINTAVKKSFGLWVYNNNSADIRCLCPKCLKNYCEANAFYIRRVDPFSSAKDKCDKCNNFGFDYFVYDKRKSRQNHSSESENVRLHHSHI